MVVLVVGKLLDVPEPLPASSPGSEASGDPTVEGSPPASADASPSLFVLSLVRSLVFPPHADTNTNVNPAINRVTKGLETRCLESLLTEALLIESTSRSLIKDTAVPMSTTLTESAAYNHRSNDRRSFWGITHRQTELFQASATPIGSKRKAR